MLEEFRGKILRTGLFSFLILSILIAWSCTDSKRKPLVLECKPGQKKNAAGVCEDAGLSSGDDIVGGGTYTLDIWPGHPFEREAQGTLAKVRYIINELRDRIDSYNNSTDKPEVVDQVVFYMGQYIKSERDSD